MSDLGRAAALALAVVLGWAAVSKARRRADTEASFRGFRLPAAALLAGAVPIVEAVTAVGLVWRPRVVAWWALVVLGAFTVVITRALARGDAVPCACFGAGAERPVGAGDLVRNAGLAALAVLATGAGEVSGGAGGRGGGATALWPSWPAALAVVVAVALGAGALRLARTAGR